jgi:hypothetical protein
MLLSQSNGHQGSCPLKARSHGLGQSQESGFSAIKSAWYRITSREPFSVSDEYDNDPLVIPLFLTISPWEVARDIGTAITIGRAILDIVKYLQTKRGEKKIHRYTINCSSTFYLALDLLRTQFVTIGRPLYFHSFGYHCLIISNDKTNAKAVHVLIFSNEGELKTHAELSL